MSQQEYVQNTHIAVDLNAIAKHALAALVPDHAPRMLDVATIENRLLLAVRDPDRRAFDTAAAKLIRAGVTCQDIANHHIPAVARTLGQAWVDGDLAFSDVSIGCARLQGHLRQKGLDWCDAAELATTSVAQVLLIVPDYEQHTLGATLLAGQLRAHGVDVTLIYHASVAQITQAATSKRYDAILMSSSRSETLVKLGKTILGLRALCTSTPIILGGNLLDQTADALGQTGADHTVNSYQAVLRIVAPHAVPTNPDVVGIFNR